jgi:hypothetical protein
MQYDRYLHMSNTNVIIPQRANDKASLALSSLIHALFEQETYAVARLVTKEAKPPIVVLLAPSIEQDYECLIEATLPFAEDVRSYQFPPLDKVVTVSGKVITEHRNLPNEELQQAMSDYVDKMELDGEEYAIFSSRSLCTIITNTFYPGCLLMILTPRSCTGLSPQCGTARCIPTNLSLNHLNN